MYLDIGFVHYSSFSKIYLSCFATSQIMTNCCDNIHVHLSGLKAVLCFPIFSLEEFTCLMQGQLDARDMELEIRDTFAVFGSEKINVSLLQLMSQV